MTSHQYEECPSCESVTNVRFDASNQQVHCLGCGIRGPDKDPEGRKWNKLLRRERYVQEVPGPPYYDRFGNSIHCITTATESGVREWLSPHLSLIRSMVDNRIIGVSIWLPKDWSLDPPILSQEEQEEVRKDFDMMMKEQMVEHARRLAKEED